MSILRYVKSSPHPTQDTMTLSHSRVKHSYALSALSTGNPCTLVGRVSVFSRFGHRKNRSVACSPFARSTSSETTPMPRLGPVVNGEEAKSEAGGQLTDNT